MNDKNQVAQAQCDIIRQNCDSVAAIAEPLIKASLRQDKNGEWQFDDEHFIAILNMIANIALPNYQVSITAERQF